MCALLLVSWSLSCFFVKLKKLMSCPCGLNKDEVRFLHSENQVLLVGGICQNPFADGSEGICGKNTWTSSICARWSLFCLILCCWSTTSLSILMILWFDFILVRFLRMPVGYLSIYLSLITYLSNLLADTRIMVQPSRIIRTTHGARGSRSAAA